MKQGHRTMPFPSDAFRMPDRFRGRPEIRPGPLPEAALDRAVAACPVGALRREDGGALALDMGACLFCGACEAAGDGVVRFTQDYRLGARRREDLVIRAGPAKRMEPLEPARLRLYARSLKLREVSAGGCNACEVDTNVLTTLAWDLGRFGIQFVASPRHADGLFVTGPVTENMRVALLKTWASIPGPRVCIVTGSCAIAGGPFANEGVSSSKFQVSSSGALRSPGEEASALSPRTSDLGSRTSDLASSDLRLPTSDLCSPPSTLHLPPPALEHHNGATRLLPVDLLIPGCPPHPATILDGLLRLLGQIA
jgi:Ni,Fe-hydrogenase III small subunit